MTLKIQAFQSNGIKTELCQDKFEFCCWQELANWLKGYGTKLHKCPACKEKTPKYTVIDIETTGLNPWWGDRITTICAKDQEGNRFSRCRIHNLNEDKTELELINDFIKWLEEHPGTEYLFITKNGKGFDIPFILARQAILTGKAAAWIIKSYTHIDMHEIPQKWVSLDDMAKLLNCTLKSGTGLQAIKLWNECKYEELVSYCNQDVDTTEEVYLKLRTLGHYQDQKPKTAKDCEHNT